MHAEKQHPDPSSMSKNKSKQTPFNFTDDQIESVLRIDNRGVINEIYKIVFELLNEENKRQKLIDTKGASSTALTGLSASLVFSLGGLLIDKITNAPLPFVGCPIPWLVCFYFTTSITLLFSMFFAYLAIRARSDWVWFSERDIFNQEVIKEEDPNYYKRYIIAHMWQLYKNNFRINETKGKRLKWSQRLFIIGLGQLIPIIAILSLYTLNKGGVY
ncbi:MAG: hypothetical protein NTX75_09600 [Proteobacteria bacterium]|nr:hypothetical protein [Pseudomonadota bacterium]